MEPTRQYLREDEGQVREGEKSWKLCHIVLFNDLIFCYSDSSLKEKKKSIFLSANTKISTKPSLEAIIHLDSLTKIELLTSSDDSYNHSSMN